MFVLLAIKTLSQEVLLPDQIFTIKIIEKNGSGKTETMPMDELVINSNKVNTGFSTKNGYPAAVITVDQERTSTSTAIFTAGCTNSKNGTLTWSCTISDNKIEGKAQQFFFGKLSGEYVFTGTLKKKK